MGKGIVMNRIKELRVAKGMTQQQLADAAEATRQTIIAVEAGKYAPSLELAFRIARTFGEDFETVFQYQAD